jgi:hypothetical protein
MAIFEFVALECIRQNEPGGDEIYLRYGSRQAYPPEGSHVPFVAGGCLINEEAAVSPSVLMELRGRKGCRVVEASVGAAEFRRRRVPVEGLTVEVMEHDFWSRHDRLGKILVSSKPTAGLVRDELEGLAGHYRITWQVLAEPGGRPEELEED